MQQRPTRVLALIALSSAFVAIGAWGCSASDGGGDTPTDTGPSSGDTGGGPDGTSGDARGDAAASDTGDGGSTADTGKGEGDASSDAIGDGFPVDSGSSGDTALAAGGMLVEFVKTDEPLFELSSAHGSNTFGAADSLARDGNLANLLVRSGLTTIGPAGATELGTKAYLSYGTTRFRVRLATCGKTEELVNGLFDYENDGKDHDGDGLVDNPEIDIEILCGQPTFLNLTSWSQYTDDTHMRKMSRIIDLETGTVFIGKADDYGYDTSDPANAKVDPAMAHPGFYDPKAFYEMGWQWSPGVVRWFIVLGGKELTLWTLKDAVRVPHSPMTMRFNLWHPSDHWNASGTVVPAAKDATLSVDWMRFDPG